MTMKRHIATFALLGVLAAGITSAAVAQSRDADSLRSTGQVGEQADGFMACVATCDAALRTAVAEINAKRADAYRRAAAEAGNGATAQAAGQAAHRQILARLPAGQWYRPLNGGWTKK